MTSGSKQFSDFTKSWEEPQVVVLTTIHNFDLKRHDGSTAAQRLLDHEFPDLFEWALG